MHTDDRRQNVAEHPYDLPDVSRMITNGEDNARQALRGWVHQKCFSNVYQRERNAKIWFDGPSVVEAWHLWAHHQHLDPDVDMPDAVRALAAEKGSAEKPADVGSSQPGGDRALAPVVVVTVPPGVVVQVVYAA